MMGQDCSPFIVWRFDNGQRCPALAMAANDCASSADMCCAPPKILARNLKPRSLKPQTPRLLTTHIRSAQDGHRHAITYPNFAQVHFYSNLRSFKARQEPALVCLGQ